MPTKALAALPDELRGQATIQAYDFDRLYRFAQVCHASGLFEDVKDAAQAFVKIAQGAELGLAPLTAMKAIDLIRGHPFLKPWAIAGLINASGYGSYQVLEQTPTRCAIQFRRRLPEVGWTDCPLVTYTLEEAQAHGLVQRSPHWKASPAHMLYQRAMGRGGAMYFPELLAGLTASPEAPPPDPAGMADAVEALYGPTRPQDTLGPLVPTRESSEAPGPLQRPPGGRGGRPPEGALGQREGAAWDTLRAHRTDPRLSEALRQELHLVVAGSLPVSEQEANTLAGQVLDWLDATEEDPHA